MCCKAPVVALDATSATEFFEDGRGYLIKQGEWDNLDGIDRPTPDIDDAILKLNECYDNPEKRAAIAQKGRNWAKEITWKETVFQKGGWYSLFEEIGEDIGAKDENKE